MSDARGCGAVCPNGRPCSQLLAGPVDVHGRSLNTSVCPQRWAFPRKAMCPLQPLCSASQHTLESGQRNFPHVPGPYNQRLASPQQQANKPQQANDKAGTGSNLPDYARVQGVEINSTLCSECSQSCPAAKGRIVVSWDNCLRLYVLHVQHQSCFWCWNVSDLSLPCHHLFPFQTKPSTYYRGQHLDLQAT